MKVLKERINFLSSTLRQQTKTDKNTTMNLCKFVADHEFTCRTTCLNKKEGKIMPVKIVFPDTLVKNSFMKNVNKLKILQISLKILASTIT